jgi:hypothetical protein
MSEKFLIKFFEKLTPADFKKDKFLSAFYQTYKTGSLFDAYISYITRNKVYPDNSRVYMTAKLYDTIKDQIIADSPTETKIKKRRALSILSDHIKQSYIQESALSDEDNQEFHDASAKNILDEIREDGRLNYAPDAGLARRETLREIYRETARCCASLPNGELVDKLTTVYFINFARMSGEVLHTVPVKKECVSLRTKTLDVVLPGETIVRPVGADRSFAQTTIRLSSGPPLQQTANYSLTHKTIYICAGSSMICGGNADQGLDVLEGPLCLSTTYTMAIERVSSVFPLMPEHAFVCPTVLLFRDEAYNILPVDGWRKISVMNAPLVYRAKTNIVNQSMICMDDRLYDPASKLIDPAAVKKSICSSIELAIFFNYTTVIFDDCAVVDNWLPAHDIARILRDAIQLYDGRIENVIVCAPASRVFNVFSQYFQDINI